MDAKQRAKEHTRAGHLIRKDQTQNPLCPDRLLGRVRVLRHQHRGHNENQVELLTRHGRGDAVQLAGVGRVLRQVPNYQETQLRGRRVVQQRHNVVVPDEGRSHHGGGVRRRRRGAGEAKGPGGRQQEEQL